jgi:RND family efflux transporter MFP subunit
MKKVIALLIAFFVLTLIIVVLLGNKARMEEKAKASIFTAYPVYVTTIAKQDLTEKLSQVGVIGANNDVAIASETQGRIIAVMVKVGSYVSAGSPIVQVDNELQKAQYLSAETSFEKTQKDFVRYEALHKDGLISDSEYETARLAFKAAESTYITARRQYNNSTITTPISGIVTARPVDIGTMIGQGSIVANVVDISRLKVNLNIAEQDAFRFHVGDAVEVETDVYPGIKFPGRIESISVKGDEAHTYPVEITLVNNKEHPLKVGMFGRVNFSSGSFNNVLAIPREALVGSIKDPQVYIVVGEVAQLRNIVVGPEFDTKLIVLKGLNEGEVLIVNGQDNLKDNVKVNVIKSN